jgi:NADH:ubiquinone oxidoreductase subunit F (NADH-binding)
MPAEDHRRLWGWQPLTGPDVLIAHVEQAGIVGAGGAAFPTARKLASLRGSKVGLVIVNGAEGESASGKDGVLLGHVPHLVLDGAAAVAHALGAPRVVVRIAADRPDLAAQLPVILAARDDSVRFELSIGPASFVAGEATAVIRSVLGGPALPADLGRPPIAPARLPWARTPVMLSNVETFARIAVATRGIRSGSALVSASGAVARPGVVELPESWSLEDVALSCGGLVGAPEVLITGGSITSSSTASQSWAVVSQQTSTQRRS